MDETLSLLSDEALIEMDDRKTQKKIERIQEKSSATKSIALRDDWNP